MNTNNTQVFEHFIFYMKYMELLAKGRIKPTVISWCHQVIHSHMYNYLLMYCNLHYQHIFLFSEWGTKNGFQPTIVNPAPPGQFKLTPS